MTCSAIVPPFRQNVLEPFGRSGETEMEISSQIAEFPHKSLNRADEVMSADLSPCVLPAKVCFAHPERPAGGSPRRVRPQKVPF